jgi:altronate dehydratase
MKKIISSVFASVLILGLGTGVLANSEEIACKVKDFKEMLPFMQEKHQDLSEKELKDMHKDCATKVKKQTQADCMIDN